LIIVAHDETADSIVEHDSTCCSVQALVC
jgi:hypothetical protein